MKTIKKDLQIFRGTYKEVQEAETLDYCIYLAWDTHELFVGNAAGKKTNYTGGKQLTQREVVELVKTLTTAANKSAREQLVGMGQKYDELSSELNSVKIELKRAIASFNQETKEYVYDIIAKIFADEDYDFSYTKTQINDMLNALHDVYYDKAEFDSWKTQHESVINNKLKNNFVQYKYGVEIVNLLDKNNEDTVNGMPGHECDGVYFALNDHNTIKKGYTYLLNGIDLIMIGGGSGGSGGVAAKAEITELYINNLPYVLIQAGTSFNTSVTLKNVMKNKESFDGILTLKQDNKDILNNIMPDDTTTFIPNLENVPISKHSYTLYGEDSSGNVISKSIYLYADMPIKYGHGPEVLEESDLNALDNSKLLMQLAGDYTAKIPTGEYFWFCVPGYSYQSEKGRLTLNTEKVKSHGFSYPLEAPIQIITTINGINVSYDCYRSASPDAGLVDLKLTIE